jgi:tungstate transport system permease protein
MRFLLEQIREAYRLMHYDSQLHPLISRTLHLAFESTGLALLIGILPAYLIGSRRSRASRWAHTLANACLGLPPVGVGILLIPTVGYGTMHDMIVAQTVLALPIIVALGATAIRELPEGLMDQARACGASGWRLALLAFREARIGFLTAVIFALGSAIAEVGAVSVVGGNLLNSTTTLSSEILLDIQGHGFTALYGGGLPDSLEHAMVVLAMLLVLAGILTIVQQWGKLKQRRDRRRIRVAVPGAGPARAQPGER